jgi:putative tryptophan/tyrosine transport system substrate-binding protein
MRRREAIALLVGGAAWPLMVRAQQTGGLHRIGVLGAGYNTAGAPTWIAFEEALRQLGYIEGSNIIFERRFGEGQHDRLPALAAELASMNVDVIVVLGPTPVPAAKTATSTIPIVMIAGSSDPIGEGLIASFARPGGNITGLTYAASAERFGKQLALLKETIGRVTRVGVLWDVDIEHFRRAWAPALQQAADQLAVQIEGPFLVGDERDFEPAFAAMFQQRVEAALVSAAGVAFERRARVSELALQNRLPIMAAFRQFPQAGSLMSYGPDFIDVYRRAATYVHKILKGERPAELPVEQPTKYELVINLKTAKLLGLTIPNSLLASADEVIE